MEKVKKLEYEVIRFALWFTSGLILAAIVIFRSAPVVIGLIFGTLIALLNFLELSKTLQRAVNMPPERASQLTSFKYFIRYAVTGIVLFVAVKTEHIDFISTAVGLLSVKLAVYATHLFNDRRFFMNILKRKEDNL